MKIIYQIQLKCNSIYNNVVDLQFKDNYVSFRLYKKRKNNRYICFLDSIKAFGIKRSVLIK